MLIKPELKDKQIISHLQDAYGLTITKILFLPIGADFNTAVYRVTTSNQKDYFLKLRSGEFLEASVSVPNYLADLGIKPIISPLATKTKKLWCNLGAFKAILYPYVDGHNAVETKLSEQQWAQFGTALKLFHDADIPKNLTNDVPRETFSSASRETVKAFLLRIENEVFAEHVAAKMALFLKSKSSDILNMIERTEKLASMLKEQPLEYILCHADIHGWNLMTDREGTLYVIDWDTLVFAPKECDLMFIGAGIWDSGRTATEEEALFYKGYGQTNINLDAISYYRFERILKDIAEYCEFIFLSDKGGDDRMQVFEHLQANFALNGTLERANQLESGPRKWKTV